MSFISFFKGLSLNLILFIYAIARDLSHNMNSVNQSVQRFTTPGNPSSHTIVERIAMLRLRVCRHFTGVDGNDVTFAVNDAVGELCRLVEGIDRVIAQVGSCNIVMF